MKLRRTRSSPDALVPFFTRLGATTLWHTILIAVVAATLCSQPTPEREHSIFAGAVHDAVTKLPIAKASLHVIPSDPKQPAYAGLSDATGAFRFEAIDPGDYRLQVRARGYAETKNIRIEAGHATALLHFAAGHDITGGAIELDPEAIITGRVTDPEGDPIAGAVVYAVTEQWQRGFRVYWQVADATANDRGDYRLRLVPGRYFLSSGPQHGVNPGVYAADPGKPEMRIAASYYPNALGIEGATPIDLRPGQQLIGISFKLSAVVTSHVRGVIRPYSGGPQGSILYLRNRNGDRSPHAAGGNALAKPDGTFEMSGIRPGSYRLEIFPIRGGRSGSIAVEVADRDIDGIVLQGIPQFELKCRVSMAGEDSRPLTPAKLHLDLLAWLVFPFSSVISVPADGALVFTIRPAGEYVISLAPEDDLYVQSISYNGREVEAGKLNLATGLAGDVQIMLSTGTGQIEGAVHYPDASPGAVPPPLPPGASAVLVSATGITGNTGARSVDIDAVGHFQFRFVPPGRYYAFISPQFDPDFWQNMDFVRELQTAGVAVEVAKKGTATADVPILTADDLRQATERLPR